MYWFPKNLHFLIFFGAKRPVQITLSALLSSRTCVILRSLLAASLALLGRYFFYNKIGFTNLTLVNLGWPTDQLVRWCTRLCAPTSPLHRDHRVPREAILRGPGRQVPGHRLRAREKEVGQHHHLPIFQLDFLIPSFFPSYSLLFPFSFSFPFPSFPPCLSFPFFPLPLPFPLPFPFTSHSHLPSDLSPSLLPHHLTTLYTLVIHNSDRSNEDWFLVNFFGAID